jgi:hypothetical protein
MVPVDEVHPYVVDAILAGAQQSDLLDDSNRITRMINHVPESDLGPCPESDDEGGDDFDLTEESDCVRIISDSDPLDDLAFMDQDAYDDLPALVDDAYVHEKDYLLDWVEEVETPEPTDKITETPGSLRKGREKNFPAPSVAFMSTLPLLFWKICVKKSNKIAHQ